MKVIAEASGAFSIRGSSSLKCEPFIDERDGLRERTSANAESAFDDAYLAADVTREIEDRRLALD
ncbi:hypothetical protein ACPOL_7047 (plasmid) [Acidisarcina polymorpha]|uniref:Uncharacterized protein n=1 Tax=Acidisarcina polymorpha TaxID=2211140 RepID=A0A2Z5GBT9_9BACT|nr:hypothetical protein ACPOL_7047 [Acidisarcina polymorpha]